MYSGRHCEYVGRYIIVRDYISKSVASVAIIIMSAAVIFIVTLDILKYVFHMDVTKEELRKIRQKKWEQKRKAQLLRKPRLAIRYVYVDRPPINEQTMAVTSL